MMNMTYNKSPKRKVYKIMRYFDMLVKLYELPENHSIDSALFAEQIRIHRPMASDKDKIAGFVRTHFSDVWANEFEKAMCQNPVSCFVAVKEGREIIGFSCYDASYANFFGPIGVLETYRGKNIGKELLLHALYAMREEGYAYGIIGWSSEKNAPFYEKAANATEIENSFPGIYRNAIGLEECEP